MDHKENEIIQDTQVLEITRDVFWVGVLDPGLVTFDVVMETKYGTTYNAYFIKAEKPTIVETVKARFEPVFVDKIRQMADPASIEYIVMDHTEPDHSGSLGRLLELAPNATVVGSGNAIRYLEDQLGYSFRHQVVKDGDSIDLGNKTLKVIGAPNLHWPDSIYTYLEEDKVLFTCDSFGCHYADAAMFDDQTGDFDEAFQYYFDVILRPFSKFLLKAIDKIRPLDIQVICPGHGPVLRTHWKKYVDLSEKLAKEALDLPDENRVFIGYVSAYMNTGMIAKAIAEGVEKAGDVTVDLCDLEHMALGEMEAKIMRSNGIVVGSPTFNQNILLPVYKVFSVINPIRDRNKPAGSFGSYGWSGEGTRIMDNIFENLKLKLVGEGLQVKFTPHEQEIEACHLFGKKIGEAVLQGK
jgi:NADH oxidase (H2O-forming)